MSSMNPWLPEPDPRIRRRTGKTGEELAELQKVIFRIAIQGIDGVDPETGKTNRECLQEELADVIAQCEETIDFFGFDWEEIERRVGRKRVLMDEWEALVEPLEA